MSTPYRPIACALHDHLEAAATLGRECTIRYRDPATGGDAVARGRIRDIYARDGAEYLRLDDREIRLDHIASLDGTPFRSSC